MRYFIFDIDGTLADCGHRIKYLGEKPKNWEAFFSHEEMMKDSLIEPIARVFELIRQDPMSDIIFVTGRPARTRGTTKQWIQQNLDFWWNDHAEPEVLYMRADGDRRNDDIVKTEIAQKIGPENIICVFEDRARVVKAWRALGIRVCQVAEGEY